MGGIAKIPGDTPDILHSYLSYVALAMHLEDKDEQLEKLPCIGACICFSERVTSHIIVDPGKRMDPSGIERRRNVHSLVRDFFYECLARFDRGKSDNSTEL